MIYGKRSNGNLHGLVLTKPVVVNAMLDMAGYVPSRDLRSIKIIEPAAGDGAFAISIIDRLFESSKNFNFSFQEALSNIRFYEIDENLSIVLKKRVGSRIKELGANLPGSVINVADFLTSDTDRADLVIGNPPYVRHENIPDKQKKTYRKLFGTFTHRSDLYVAFYEKSLRILTPNGVLSFICSNRWLKNQYGKRLREFIGLNFSLDRVLDLEKINPFEEEVIAYPAITIIRNSEQTKKTKYYQINDVRELMHFPQSVAPLRTLSTNTPNNWFMSTQQGQAYEKYLDTIINQGFKIGIGVATGADKVFIRNDFHEIVESELLLPILTSKDLKSNQFKWSGKFILNPFAGSGKLIELEKYPRAKAYLQSQKEVLLKRHVSKKNPANWYRTIDRIRPELTQQNKIVLPDISGNSHLFIDRGNYYPHHNLYYITGQEHKKLVLLAAILMSDFVKDQLSELGNKMNGGYPRWQSQNLKKLRVPIIDAMPTETCEKLIDAYNRKDIIRINEIIKPSRIKDYSFSSGQMKLFEPDASLYKRTDR